MNNDSSWHPIAIPAARDPLATPFGFVLDHIWRAPGTNAARRPHWPEDMYISVLPCIDLDPPNELTEGATHWIFFDNEIEYGGPEEDREASDWLVGELEDA